VHCLECRAHVIAGTVTCYRCGAPFDDLDLEDAFTVAKPVASRAGRSASSPSPPPLAKTPRRQDANTKTRRHEDTNGRANTPLRPRGLRAPSAVSAPPPRSPRPLRAPRLAATLAWAFAGLAAASVALGEPAGALAWAALYALAGWGVLRAWRFAWGGALALGASGAALGLLALAGGAVVAGLFAAGVNGALVWTLASREARAFARHASGLRARHASTRLA